MLTRLKWLLFISLLNVNADLVRTRRKSEERPIVVKMDPEQVVETFKTVLYSPYFRDMANQIATHAVEHYINVKNKKDVVVVNQNDRDSVARQRPKYSAQYASQQQQQQELQQLGDKKTYKEVIKEQDENKNVPAGTSIVSTGGEPQSLISDSESQGQTENKLKNGEPNKSILSEQVAYELLKDPSPDGDLGLGLDSLEQPTSSKPAPPPKKINGMYFRKRRRRLLSK